MNKITKAVIPVAGKGTRFLPVTKVLTKTLFPIINKPVIHYIVEEVVAAGITDIIIVINNSQKWIKEYFDNHSSYYKDLDKKVKELVELEELNQKIKIQFVTQFKPLGLGHALLCAKKYIGNDDFALLLGDDLIEKDKKENYGIKDLVDNYYQHPAYYIGVIKVSKSDASKYGIIEYKDSVNNVMHLTGMVEKPKENPPSLFAACGRYVLKNSIFQYFSNQHNDSNREIELTDALALAIKKENVYAKEIIGKRFDIGSHIGYVKATINYAMNNDEIKQDILPFLKNSVNEHKTNN